MKIRIAAKKPSNKSWSALNFVQKSARGHMAIFPRSGARGLESFIRLKYYIYRNDKKYIPFRAQHCGKYASQPKYLQIKVVRH